MTRRGGVLLSLLALLDALSSVCGEFRVTSCPTLLEAFLKEDASELLIVGDVSCISETEWPKRIVLNRTVSVTGAVFAESFLSIPDATTITLPPGVSLFFDNLVFSVHLLEDGVTLPFIEIASGAEVFVENTAIISEECHGHALSGVGRAVRDGRVDVYNADGEEIVHSCNTVHLCAEDGGISTSTVHSLEISKHRDECQHGSFSLNSEDASSSDASSIVMISVLTSIIFAALVIVLIVVVVLLISKKHMAPTPGVPNQDYRNLDSAERGQLERHETDSRTGRAQDPLLFGNGNFKLSDVEIGEHLGRGSFGKVYKGHWQGTDVAVKCIVHGRNVLEDRHEPYEAYLSRQVSHPNVIQTFIVHTVVSGGAAPTRNEALVDSITSEAKLRETNNDDIMSTDDFLGMSKAFGDHDVNSLETWIVLEFCDKGALSGAIQSGMFCTEMGGVQRPNIVHVILTALDIAHAMMYLHNVRIIHGDLKAENILLKSDAADPRGFVCKVGDFGLSRFLAADTHIQTFTCGTITHMPPEVLKGGVLTPGADVYSFAVLMWELLSGTTPYGMKTHGEIMDLVVNRQKRPPIPEDCPDGYAELLEDCWRQSHLERPGFPEIVDRLKDLHIEEETIHRSSFERDPDTPDIVIHAREKGPFEDAPSMSSEHGLSSNTRPTHNRDGIPFSGLDMDLDVRSNPCFMMSTELSVFPDMAPEGTSALERDGDMRICGRISEADEARP